MNKVLKYTPWFAALALVAVFLLALAGPLRGLVDQGVAEGSGAAVSSDSGYPLQEPTASAPLQAYPGPENGVTEPTTLPAVPTATLLPDQGVRLSELEEVVIDAAEDSVGQIYAVDLVGNTLVAAAQEPSGLVVVTIDLTTGEFKQVSQPVPGLNTISASQDYITWFGAGSQEDTETLQVYRLATDNLIPERALTVGKREMRFLDLKESVAAWVEYRDKMFTIVVYDLDNGAELAVIGGPGVRVVPKICGGDWVEYLNMEDGFSKVAEVHAHNINTGEDFVVGHIPVLNSAEPPDRYHDCDSGRIAWISGSVSEGYAQHIYDLDKRLDRVLDVPVPTLGVSQVLLSGNILIGPAAGYDLMKDVPFSLTFPIPFHNYTSSRLMLSGDRIAVLINELNGLQHLYTTSVVRD